MVLVSWDSSGIWASHSVLGCFLNPSQQTAVRKLMCTATVCCLKRYVILLMTTIAVSIPRNIRVQAVLCRYTVMCITHMSLISRCAVCNIASALQVRHSGAGHPSASGSAAPLTALHLHSMPHLPDHQLPHDSVLSLAQSGAVTITPQVNSQHRVEVESGWPLNRGVLWGCLSAPAPCCPCLRSRLRLGLWLSLWL
jgi:hypothetical protein